MGLGSVVEAAKARVVPYLETKGHLEGQILVLVGEARQVPRRRVRAAKLWLPGVSVRRVPCFDSPVRDKRARVGHVVLVYANPG